MTNFLKNTLAALLVLGAVVSAHSIAFAQASAPSSVLPTGGGAALLDPSDTVILLLDHQAGLFQTVKDISVSDLRANVTVLAKLATLLKIPVITTASEPNGPIMPEIKQFAPHSVYVARKGEVNAWDNEDFVRTVRGTERKTLIMAGVWTSVCVMFPALDAKAGVQSLCSDGCLRRSERNGIAHDARSLRASWCHSHLHERGFVRGSSYVEPTRSVRTRKALCPRGAELRRFD